MLYAIIDIETTGLSHLNNNRHKKAIEMKNAITRVEYKITGSELAALLLESSEIKKHQPVFNRAQRRTYFNYGLYSFIDDEGYINLKLMKIIILKSKTFLPSTKDDLKMKNRW